MYTGPLRLLRALTVSGTCVALSFAAHLVGAGAGVPVWSPVAVAGLLTSTVLLTLVLMTLSGQRWTLGRSLAALALGQFTLNTIFTVLLSSHHVQYPTGANGAVPMALAHGVAALVIGVAIAVNDAALDTYFCVATFCVATSVVGPGVRLLSPWRLSRLIAGVDAAAATHAAGSGDRAARWRRPRIRTDLVVLQCLSRRGPPAFALAS